MRLYYFYIFIIDPENGVIYLFGGWDGEKDLGK
jgi:hypothetical protein